MSMSTSSDLRRVIGAHINTIATAVTSISECKRLYGGLAKTKRVNGIVRRVIVNDPPSGPASTALEVIWTISDNRTKTCTIKLDLIKAGEYTPSSQIKSQSQNENDNIVSTHGSSSQELNQVDQKITALVQA